MWFHGAKQQEVGCFPVEMQQKKKFDSRTVANSERSWRAVKYASAISVICSKAKSSERKLRDLSPSAPEESR